MARTGTVKCKCGTESPRMAFGKVWVCTNPKCKKEWYYDATGRQIEWTIEQTEKDYPFDDIAIALKEQSR